jgi:pimeloyl-ACP methyl ester carboxylesterase
MKRSTLMKIPFPYLRALLAAVSLLMSMAVGAAPVPIESKYAEVNGIRLHYAESGSGKLVLFLHGFPEYWYQWKPQLEDLGQDFRAVAPDMRGYNQSSIPADVGAYKIRTLVEDVRALTEHLGHRKFVLVGQDWGGIVAWAFALYYPDRLEKLVIMNAPHPAVFERELRDNPAQQHASQYMLLFNTPDAEKVLADQEYAGLTWHVLSDGLTKGYVSEDDKTKYLALWNDGRTITGGLAYYRAARIGPPPTPGDAWSVRKHFATDFPTMTVKVPTLLIWGMQDLYLLAGNLSGLAQYVPDMQVRLFPDAPHWINRAKAKEVNDAIREFIAAPAKR